MKQFMVFFIFFLSTIFLKANDAKLLFYGNCIACHGEILKPSAPYISEIKGYYLLAYPKKKDFIANMAKWLAQPDEKTAQLPAAIEKYNLMPYLSIDLDTLTKISTYIYENDDFGIVNNF